MTTGADRPRFGDRELAAVIATAPIVASILGWVNAVEFYGPFGVNPGDVGLAVSDLIAPVAYSASVVLISALIARSFAADFRPRVQKLAGLLAVLALFVAMLAQWIFTTGRVTLAAAAIGAILGFELQSKRARGKRIEGTDVVNVGGVLAGLVAGVLISSTPFAGGAQSATPFALRFGPVARFVRVIPVAGSTELVWLGGAACAVHLGDGPAGRVLVVAERAGERARVVFVNSQLVSVEASDRCAIELPDGQKLAP